MSEKNRLDTQLIVIDGLPGSGKSTNGAWLARQFQQQGLQARFLPEVEIPHPLWWYDHWDGENYLPPDFDHAPIETFIQTSLERWKGFVSNLMETDQICVTESVFFQNAIAMFLMADARPDRLIEYAREVQHITRDLNPVLVYFYQADVVAALRRICDLRGQEFENELIQNMEHFAYLRHRNLSSLDGIAELWRDIRKLTDALFEEYTIRKLALDVSGGDWVAYRQRILRLLNLS